MLNRLLLIWATAIAAILMLNRGFPDPFSLVPTDAHPAGYRVAASAALVIWLLGLFRMIKA